MLINIEKRKCIIDLLQTNMEIVYQNISLLVVLTTFLKLKNVISVLQIYISNLLNYPDNLLNVL